MKQNHHLPNPLLQPIKGVFIFQKGDEFASRTLDLMKSLDCEVVTNHKNRMMVKTSRGNLQSIKQKWLSVDENNPSSKELKACVVQILIGGKA